MCPKALLAPHQHPAVPPTQGEHPALHTPAPILFSAFTIPLYIIHSAL